MEQKQTVEEAAKEYAENNKATLSGELDENGINNTISDFKAGAEWAASLPTNSMQWVRADKRLPEMDAEYFVFIDDYKSVAIFIDGAFWSDDIKVDVKRWLDESAPTEPTPDNESKSADWRKNNL